MKIKTILFKLGNNKNNRIFRITVLALIFILCMVFTFLSISNSVPFEAYIMFLLYWIFVALVLLIPQNNIFLTFFAFSFGIFLIAGEAMQYYFNAPRYYEFSEAINRHTYISISLSLIGLMAGVCIYLYFYNQKYNIRNFFKNDTFLGDRIFSVKIEPRYLLILRWLSLLVFIPSILVSIYMLYEQLLSVFDNGFFISYLGYHSSLPYLMQKLKPFGSIAFYVILATLPSRKFLIVPLILFFIDRSILLFLGLRFPFVLFLLFMMGYFVFRDRIKDNISPNFSKVVKKEKWINWQLILIIFLLIPSTVALMNQINKVRVQYGTSVSAKEAIGNYFQIVEGKTEKNDEVSEEAIDKSKQVNGLAGEVVEFLSNQGFSINVIKFGKQYQDELPKKKIYSLGSTIDYYKNNPIGRILGLDSKWYQGGNSIEKARYSNQYAHALSYKILGDEYLKGRGIGSSFIAEVYHDFSYLGVFIASMIYGALFYFFFYRPTILRLIFGFISFDYLLKAPRGSYDAFFAESFNITNIFVLMSLLFGSVVIYKVSDKVRKRQKK